MSATDLPTVAQMTEITNTLHLVIIAMLGGVITIIGVIVAQAKIFIPRTMRRRDEQRKLEIDALKKELENKHTAEAIEIERERMLPQMMANNQRLVESMIQSNSANTDATIQRIEQDKHSAAVLEANTRQLTTAADRLEENAEKLQAVERKVENLYNKFTVVFPREKSIDELFSELREVVTGTKQVVGDRRGDSRPIPTITADITLHTANGSESPTLPDVLKPTGTG